MKMKIKIDNAAYKALKSGKKASATAINDNVSTTRHDVFRVEHQCEPRIALVRAFLRASDTRRINVVADRYPDPLSATIIKVGAADSSGLAFGLELLPLEKKSVRSGK